ncbi:MAG: tetratricopeptide repeat protein [Planctomycetota bacterium]
MHADEHESALRLPAWVEVESDAGVEPASFRVPPKPPQRFRPAPSEPRPLQSELVESDLALSVRQLEYAASEACGEHALTRVIERFQTTRKGLNRTGDRKLVSRTDRVGSWALHARGRARSERGELSKSVADYRAAVRIDPGNLAAWHDLGVTLADRGDHAEALSAFDAALNRSPNSTEALRNRAALLIRLGEAERGVVDCDRALKHLPAGSSDRTAVLRLRGTALHGAGRLREAARDFDAVLGRHPDDIGTRVARAHVFAEAGFYEQAIQDYATALQADPSLGEAYRSLAWVLATCPETRLRDPETAIEAAWRARRLLGDNDRRTLDASAAAHASAGEFGEAIRFQQRLLMQLQDSDDIVVAAAENRLEAYRANRPYVASRATAKR